MGSPVTDRELNERLHLSMKLAEAGAKPSEIARTAMGSGYYDLRDEVRRLEGGDQGEGDPGQASTSGAIAPSDEEAATVFRSAEEADELGAPMAPAWRVRHLEALNYALQRMGELEREIAENTAMAEEAKRRIDQRLEQLNRSVQWLTEFYRQRVTEYCESNRTELLGHGKKKSRKLIHGTVQWRATPEQFDIVNEDAALAWALEQVEQDPTLDFVELKPRLRRAALLTHIRTTGELPPGVQRRPPEERFYVRPAEPIDGNQLRATRRERIPLPTPSAALPPKEDDHGTDDDSNHGD